MKIEIGRHNRIYSDMRFIIRALGEAKRYAMDRIKIEAGHIIATDGWRLHIIDGPHTYEPGTYEVIKNNQSCIVLLKDDEDALFPKWEDSIPQTTHCFDVISGSVPARSFIPFGLAQKGICCNPDHLNKAIENYVTAKVYFSEPERAIIITQHKTRRAVIMSIVSPVIEISEAE